MDTLLILGQFLFFQLSFASSLVSARAFIPTITTTIDLIAVIITAVSIFQVLFHCLPYNGKSHFNVYAVFQSHKHSNSNMRNVIYPKWKKSLISGLLFALELESANAILKLGLFTSVITQAPIFYTTTSASTQSGFGDISNDFIFFVGVLSLRITINHSLRRFS